MQQINYRKGDATCPQGEGKKVIAHIVNSSGGWGNGFVVDLGKKYPLAEKAYRAWHKAQTEQPDNFLYDLPDFELGEVQRVIVDEDVMVVNMLAQEGYVHPHTNPVAVRYPELSECLEAAMWTAWEHEASLHMPRIGIGRGGGTWEEVLECFEKAVSPPEPVDVFVYDLS